MISRSIVYKLLKITFLLHVLFIFNLQRDAEGCQTLGFTHANEPQDCFSNLYLLLKLTLRDEYFTGFLFCCCFLLFFHESVYYSPIAFILLQFPMFYFYTILILLLYYFYAIISVSNAIIVSYFSDFLYNILKHIGDIVIYVMVNIRQFKEYFQFVLRVNLVTNNYLFIPCFDLIKK